MDKRSYSEEVGAWIQEQRMTLGISQGELGEAIGVTGAAVGAWERGVATLSSYSHNRLRAFFHERGATPAKAEQVRA